MSVSLIIVSLKSVPLFLSGLQYVQNTRFDSTLNYRKDLLVEIFELTQSILVLPFGLLRNRLVQISKTGRPSLWIQMHFQEVYQQIEPLPEECLTDPISN